MERNDIPLMNDFPRLRALAEDIESTLTVIAYSDISDLKGYIKKRQQELKQAYGISINCGAYGTIYTGEPNILRTAGNDEDLNIIHIGTNTWLEFAYMDLMQLLCEEKTIQEIKEECSSVLTQFRGETGGLIGSDPLMKIAPLS